jgi:hypothetical protein
MPIGERWGLRFEIDLVLYDRENGHPIAVLDTKYKPKERPETEDVERIVAYAHAKRCRKAVLLYPVALPVSFNEQVGDIRVRSLAFGLGGDLEESGQQFLTKILELMTTAG